jgi:hypothetical protein
LFTQNYICLRRRHGEKENKKKHNKEAREKRTKSWNPKM